MRTSPLLCSALLLLACRDVGTSSGNPNDGSGDDFGTATNEGSSTLGGPACARASKATVVESLDEDPGVGFSAADILAFAEGTHEEPLHWNPQELATIGPESGDGELTITVQHAGGELRYMEPTTEAGGSGAEPATDIGLPGGECRAWLEIDVEVTLKSAGGALDERFDATLASNNSLVASLFVHPDPDQLGGALEATDIKREGYVLGQLDLSISFSPFGVSGSLSGHFVMRTPDAQSNAASRGGPLAEWGAARCSDGGFAVSQDDEVNGASGADLLALLEAVPSVELGWNDDTRTTASLAFEPQDDGACVVLDASFYGETGLRVRGALALTSEDGRVDGSWPGTLYGAFEADAGVTQLVFELDDTGVLPQPTPDNLASVYGLPMIESAGYDTFSFSLQLTVDVGSDATDAPSVMGELALRGFVQAPCAEPEPTPDPDPMDEPGSTPPGSSGGSTPGCQGADVTDLLVGSIE